MQSYQFEIRCLAVIWVWERVIYLVIMTEDVKGMKLVYLK